MTELVRDHAGQLIFALRKGHHLPRDVDATARECESVNVIDVKEEKLKLYFSRRQVLNKPSANLAQPAGYLFIVNDSVVAL